MERQLVYNAIQTPDGTIIESTSRHEMVTHVDANGNWYMADGGLAYARRGYDSADYKELAVYSDDPIKTIREVMLWGTYGPLGDQPYIRILLKDMDESHIQAILETQPHISEGYRNAFERELQYRN